ncbi:MAG: alpha/beta fold hydrolase, partial [Armatimonadota bacterium]
MPHFNQHGHELFYREAGEGPVLVLLPGNTASSASYANEIAHFARHHRVIAVDFRGTGQSGRMERWPLDWWSRAADDTVALLHHVGAENACLVGSSGGAVVALMVAQRTSERLTAVIADSCARRSQPELLRAAVAARRARSRDAVAFWRHAHGADWEQVVEADNDLLLRF